MRGSLGGTSRGVSHPDWRATPEMSAQSSSSTDGACRSMLASPHNPASMNVPAIGIIPAGPGSLMRTGGEGRTRGPGPFVAASADKRRRSVPLENANGCEGTACPPESAAHLPRMCPCRDAGDRAMSVPGAGNRTRERLCERGKGGRPSEIPGISVSSATFRAARDRSTAPRFAHDNCRYRA